MCQNLECISHYAYLRNWLYASNAIVQRNFFRTADGCCLIPWKIRVCFMYVCDSGIELSDSIKIERKQIIVYFMYNFVREYTSL